VLTISLTSEDDPVGMVRRSLHKLNASEVLPVAHGLLEESLRAEIKESQKLRIFCVHKIEQDRKECHDSYAVVGIAPISINPSVNTVTMASSIHFSYFFFSLCSE
jgi:hypothetical protein